MGIWAGVARALDKSADKVATRKGKVVRTTKKVVDGLCVGCLRPTGKQQCGVPCCGRTQCMRVVIERI
ncbi:MULTISPECIES: hypothetical protein [Prauserella]|uniref:Uncharacterized protein n=2 Tax=Prauserella TaxID=142577 RepID=A0A318LP97_9PSEU|nr:MULTISPECIES: hypothetical protein [Prauserella]PXY29181.1 hypothetical protein BAY59_16340 [Prauserella coralliicola]PXY36221.1 hypothetical protein BA062_12355 [Prauserella flavalba]RBM21531.1 hypothetical protein DI005_09675 [Prauserella sp. PE36]TKG72871.1 hypothetical protein FCN18_06545 [Prauserella endophytica]